MARYTGHTPEFEGQCEAHSHNRDARCRNKRVLGTNICYWHGAAAPQVKESARQRLAALVDPALDVMKDVLKPGSGRVVPKVLQVAVAKDVLDRTGYKSPEKLDITAFSVDPRHLSDEDLEMVIQLRERLAQTQQTHDDGPDKP